MFDELDSKYNIRILLILNKILNFFNFNDYI